MNDIILQINAIKKSFVRNIINVRGEQEDERFYIIDDLDLFIPRGKITALIGGNGAGKTTLFNIVSRLTEAESGDVIFQTNGNPLSLLKMPPFKISRLGIGRLFQDDHIIANMSVLDNMLLA
ncbi:MAG: ATP-binding cassette domain-containing protein, partial [Candidatus Lokiarchaeota archaeon]|nr:ATP-binding cassette domain-containing protein [Candidatus Lokiarchaeota archaeon]